jgi:hypothetical protein
MTVKKHKDAIKNLRLKLKDLAEVKPKLRAEIAALKFDAEGKHRPETGSTRHGMKQSYKDHVRPEIRAVKVAYGILKGKAYKRLEPKVDPYSYSTACLTGAVLREIHAAIGEDTELKAAWTKERVKAIINGADPIALEAA